MMGCTKFSPFVSCTITGRFDSAALARFANLVTLGLSGLDLGDLSLDTLVHNLGSLQKLYLFGVNISVLNPSPTGLVTTPVLQELTMSGCKITGPIDIFLAKLRFLSKLTLDNSDFVPTDRVLESFTNFSSLVLLSLQDCGLNGTFPSRIFHIKSLAILDVSFNKNLSGELPEFKQGSVLQVLVLSGTKFSRPIPESIGNLKNLTILDLYSCQFHGFVSSFAQWPEISMVDLSSNNLTGFLPSDGYLGLDNLMYINLENNSVSGEIPVSLFSHPHLQYLHLSQNNFTGNFLLYPNASQRLRMIDISKNKLQGPIPKSISKLLGLEELDLSSNNFTGTVDLNLIKNYVNMTLLSLSNNRLSVVIMEDGDTNFYQEYPHRLDFLGLASCNLTNVPEFLRHQKLLHLDLSNNNIAGHIPDWIWENGKYDAVNLSHNSFSSIQTDLSVFMYGLFYLDLHSNKIEGALPLPPCETVKLDYSNNHFNSSVTTEFWSQISSSSFVFLSNNSLVGEVPPLLCNGTDIEILDLSFNRFSGLIPPCLLKHKNKLEILKLRGNNFHGSVPQKISKECALQIIDINDNKLEGKLPASLVNCRMLQLLDLGNNEIVDTFPEWLGVLPLLKVLVLNDNRFNGHIDQYGRHKQMHSYFPALQVLDLSSNAFTGGIPTLILKKLKAMMVPSSSGPPSIYTEIIADLNRSPPGYMPYDKSSFTITLKGQETTMVSILPIFMYLDLSNNNFDGTISDGIGDLKLLKGLNLSRNSFTGHIPPRIANMLQLESLDLSYNKLSGKIPPELALLTFLEVLNLSYNHLSGPIPQSNQFSTFPETSFLGNDGLCGKPLPHPCTMNRPPSAPAAPDSSTEVNWDVLGIEVGVISGLATVVITALLWGNGRRWIYYQVDRFFMRVLQPRIHHRRRRRH
ncbi:receptor like protein 22-like [Miscanthus floridulus]|uniref:receptor like protein 22-like n=1 Tax=Miscanthus floridulus TaxID=154761 RepID=UPI0034578081